MFENRLWNEFKFVFLLENLRLLTLNDHILSNFCSNGSYFWNTIGDVTIIMCTKFDWFIFNTFAFIGYFIDLHQYYRFLFRKIEISTKFSKSTHIGWFCGSRKYKFVGHKNHFWVWKVSLNGFIFVFSCLGIWDQAAWLFISWTIFV